VLKQAKNIESGKSKHEKKMLRKEKKKARKI